VFSSALGLFVSVLAAFQSVLQFYLALTHHLAPLYLFSFNAVIALFWIVVIAIGWNPTGWWYDERTGGYSLGISGWLYNYSNDWATDSVTGGVSPTLALAVGFGVMAIVSL
jgi:hypothetical protein